MRSLCGHHAKCSSGDPFGTWSRPRGGTTAVHTCLWGLRWPCLIRRVSVGTFSGPTTRRSCFALSLWKTPGFLRSGSDSCPPLLHELNQRASEEKGSFLSIPKPSSPWLTQGGWKSRFPRPGAGFLDKPLISPSDTQVWLFPSTVHPEDPRYGSVACANLDTVTELFAALGISRHFSCPLSWPMIVTRPTQEVQVTSGFLCKWVYMQQSVHLAQLVQQGQLCTRVNKWPRGFWVTWKLRCTITQISACLERRKCRKRNKTLQSCTLAQQLGLWSQMSRAWSLTPLLTEQVSSFWVSVLIPYPKMGIMTLPPPHRRLWGWNQLR